jgi:HSP20 family protein
MKLVKNSNPMDFFFSEAFAPTEDYMARLTQFRPAAEVTKSESNGYKLRLALPGIPKEDVKIELHNNLLTISGERKSEHTEQEKNVIKSEFSYGKFSRSFSLNEEINKAEIRAEFKDGVLIVDMPISEKALPTTININ